MILVCPRHVIDSITRGVLALEPFGIVSYTTSMGEHVEVKRAMMDMLSSTASIETYRQPLGLLADEVWEDVFLAMRMIRAEEWLEAIRKAVIDLFLRLSALYGGFAVYEFTIPISPPLYVFAVFHRKKNVYDAVYECGKCAEEYSDMLEIYA